MNTQKPDLTAVNLAEIALKDGVMLRGGAEKCGACPKCGGKDRFHVRSFGGRNYFFCRQCHEQRGDAIEYMRWLHGMSFKQALDALGAKAAAHKPVERPIAEPVELAPARAWQAEITKRVDECAAYLHSDNKKAVAALNYLHRERGLQAATIKAQRIGYNPTARTVGEGWIAEGFTLPTVIFGDVWQVRIRRPPKQVTESVSKYTGIKGNRAGLLGADELTCETKAVVIVGGEFDKWLLQQFAPHGVTVATFGSESKRPHPRWLNMLRGAASVYIAFDNDHAGDLGAVLWAQLPQARRARVPAGKDVTDFYKSGGDVAAWLEAITGISSTEYLMREEGLILAFLERVGYQATYSEAGHIVANRVTA